MSDPKQAVIARVGEAITSLDTAVDKLKEAVTSDREQGARDGGRELKILAEQVSDVKVQASALKARLE